QVLDHMAFDGLENAYDGKPMGHFADKTAEKYGFTREQMDAYAKTSTERAVKASTSGAFTDEIAAVTVKGRKGDEVVKDDETPFSVNVEKIPTLRPAFNKDGRVTATDPVPLRGEDRGRGVAAPRCVADPGGRRGRGDETGGREEEGGQKAA